MTFDLGHHGDAEVAAGLVDLAVNVRREPMPAWLAEPIAESLTRLSAYPDDREATAAVAGRHRREPGEVLLTAGAAQAFVLLAQALKESRHPVVVHPQFTEPEAALRNAGHTPGRVLLREQDGFRLDARSVPDDADLVFVGNPTNPTSVLHPADEIAKLARPGRVLVVDEAFADTTYRPQTSGEPESLADRADLPGLVVLRSLTKTWGLAGLRIGYVLGPAELILRLARCRPLWAVSTPALAAATACASPVAVATEREIAARLAAEREHLVRRLTHVPKLTVAGDPASAFVAVRLPGADQVRLELRERGYAVRRGDTFPGLGADWLRIAVRDTATTDTFVRVLTEVLDRRDRGATVTLEATVAAIRPAAEQAMAAARDLQARLTKPAGSLGALEDLSVRLSGLAGTCPPPMPQPATVAVFAGDHGVHAQGVTPWPQEVTAQMVANFLAGGAVVNAFARQAGVRVTVVDVGVATPLPAGGPDLIEANVRRGTRDMTVEPAMTRAEARQAVETGIRVAEQLLDAGAGCLLTGDMGIANTTPAAALIAAFTGATAAAVTGRGTGIDDATYARKIEVVAAALARHAGEEDSLGVLAAVGGLEHAALAGFVLAAAARRVPVIIDGVIALSAALAAAAFAPGAVAAMVAGHRSTEPGASVALAHLGLEPLLDLGMRLGEGSGAVLAHPIVLASVRVLHEVATFDAAGVSEK